MYVCLCRRALASSNVDCTCAMLNHARYLVVGVVRGCDFCCLLRTLLEEDYRKVLETRLKASLPASTTGYATLATAMVTCHVMCSCVCAG